MPTSHQTAKEQRRKSLFPSRPSVSTSPSNLASSTFFVKRCTPPSYRTLGMVTSDIEQLQYHHYFLHIPLVLFLRVVQNFQFLPRLLLFLNLHAHWNLPAIIPTRHTLVQKERAREVPRGYFPCSRFWQPPHSKQFNSSSYLFHRWATLSSKHFHSLLPPPLSELLFASHFALLIAQQVHHSLDLRQVSKESPRTHPCDRRYILVPAISFVLALNWCAVTRHNKRGASI